MDGYKEYMVSRDITIKDNVKRALSLGVAILFTIMFLAFAGVLAIAVISFILAVVMYVATFLLVIPGTDLEFEYLYLDKQLTVDKVLAKSRRKNMGVYDIERMELLCPADSDRNKAFGGRTLKEYDYSSQKESEDYKRYVMYYEGNQKILLDLPTDFVKMVQNNAPRKVYFD